MNNYICNLADIDTGEYARFGRKTVNLADLYKLNYRVALGYGISIECFDAFRQYNDIGNGSTQNMQARIGTGKFPAGISKELNDIWRRLNPSGDRPLIVRSSAIEEDGADRSFAGIYESFINIRDYKGFEEGVKRCWSSYFAARAVAYRGPAADNPSLSGMGILVQNMIEGEKSGVLFTGNPASAGPGEMLIEAYPGMNLAVVNGTAPADRYAVDRDGRVIRQDINAKKVRYVPGGHSFVIDARGIPPEESTGSTLSDDEIKKLAGIGLELEKHYGWPCDIEWTIKNGDIYLLQVRPVSAGAGAGAVDADRYDCDIPEDVECSLLDRYASPACVCYLSLLECWENEVYLDLYSRTEGRYSAHKPLLFFFNRVYWNIRYQRAAYDDIPFDKSGRRALLKKIKLLRLMLTGYKKWYRRLGKYERYLNYFSSRETLDLELPQLKSTLNNLIDMFCNFIGKDHFQLLGLAQVCHNLVSKKLSAFCNAKQAMVDFLQCYVHGNMTVQSNLELLELAKEADKHPGIKRLFLDSRAEDIYPRLDADINVRTYREKIDSFLVKHGHRGTSCDDLYTPHWSEDPSCVLEIIRQFIALDSMEVLSAGNNTVFDKHRYWSDIRKKLSEKYKGIIKRLIEMYKLKKLMALTAEYMTLRENQRYYFDKSWILLRKMLLRTGHALVEKGILQEKEQVFHLSIDEIFSIIDNLPEADAKYWRELVQQRVRVYERNTKITPPYLLKDQELLRLQGNKSKTSYKAIGISPGRTAGPVRVITSVTDIGRVQRGDILVVATFHPSWTPVLSIVGGIVMNYGNILSHGAVVAREYKIPVVVFNDMATQMLEDNTWVEIDGTNGRIRVLGAAAAEKQEGSE